MGALVDLAARLFPFNYSVTGAGNDASLAVLAAELPFTVAEYESGRVLNGWEIPPECVVEKAELRRDGRLVYDAKAAPLGVPALCESFTGRVTLEQLRPHLFTAPDRPEAVPYHWMRLYRPREQVWGFCLPARMADALPPGDYDVDIRVRPQPARMKVLVHELPGESPETYLFNAHNCHPFQANDDISGIVVGIETLRRLAREPRRRYTYALMVAPELFGPMFWLDEGGEARARRLRGTVMLKSVGNDAPLRLQHSFGGDADVDLAARAAFAARYGRYESGEFRAIYGNDETVFEAPPYEIPSVSFTRWPFPEYHTDQDVPARLHEARLEDAVGAALDLCRALEANIRPVTVARGLVCLSRYGLYKPVPPVGPAGVDYRSVAGRWNRLMNALPRLMDGRTDLLRIAARFDLPPGEVHAYVRAWIEQGLAREAGPGGSVP